MTLQKLGKKIKEGRQKKGLTQEQMSRIIKKSRGLVSEWEIGRKQPGSLDLILLGALLNLKLW